MFRLVKTLGRDYRPLATPNQLIILACQGYSRRDPMLTINSGDDAEGAWIAINKPELVDAVAQRMALEFNSEREGVREARTIAALNHTNICHLCDVGPDYLVMEYHMAERRHSCAGEMI